jgi:predicted permease
VGLSLMLVATAFLFLRSLSNAAATDPGFATANIQIATVDVSLSGYHGQDAVALAGRYLERLRAIDGVESVAHARMIPLQGSGFGMGGLRVPGAESRLPEGMVDADWDVVSSDYFTTLRLPIVEGRAFTAADREGTPFVAVINEEFARQAWPNQSAVGRVVLQELGDNEKRELMVVGVAKDAKYRYISSPPAPFIYVPTAQQPLSDVEFYIRHAPGRVVSRDIRSAMALVEPSVPVVMLQSFEDAAAVGLLPQRMTAWIAGSVGTIGIFLAALGLYGLMTFIVVQRTREIAIRMALGASSRDMQSMVLQHAGRLAIIGGVIGLALAGAVGTLAQSLLVGVPPIDPLVLGSTATLFAVVLALAAWTPARRAAATDPAQALRAE